MITTIFFLTCTWLDQKVDIGPLSPKQQFVETNYLENGLSYKINVSNTSSLNYENDFIAFKDQHGHKITYPLTCKKRV
jgi:hypothetical protein